MIDRFRDIGYQHIPYFKHLIIEECTRPIFDTISYSSQDDCILQETFHNLNNDPSFSKSFLDYYHAVLKNNILPRLTALLKTLLALRDHLGVTPAESFRIIRELSDDTDRQNVITDGPQFSWFAKTEIINSIAFINYNPSKDNDYISRIGFVFHSFKKTTQAAFITNKFQRSVAAAADALEIDFMLPQDDVVTLLCKLSADAIFKMGNATNNVLDHAFYILQTPISEDLESLKSALNHYLHNQIAFNTLRESEEISKVMINNKFLTALTYLPKVQAVKGKLRLNDSLITLNKKHLRSAFNDIILDGNVTHHFPMISLPTVDAETIKTADELYNIGSGAAAGACLVVVGYAALKIYSIFTKPKVTAIEENRLAEEGQFKTDSKQKMV